MKAIGVRADTDILPMQGGSDIPYKLECGGAMHICGHDAHIVTPLGVAKVLDDYKEHLEGTVRLIFQLAKGIGKGYVEIPDYLSRTGGVDWLVGLHIQSTLPMRETLLILGSVFAGGSGFTITVKGQGGHGVRPDLTRKPIRAACDIALKMSAIPSNTYDVLDHSVVLTDMIESGTPDNIFPNIAMIGGTIWYYKPSGDEALMEYIRRIRVGAGIAYNVEVDCNFSGDTPSAYNQPELIAHTRELVDGIDSLVVNPQQDPTYAGDNFGCILWKYPDFCGVLGAENKEVGRSQPQHNMKSNVDEGSLRRGCELMTAYVADYLR